MAKAAPACTQACTRSVLATSGLPPPIKPRCRLYIHISHYPNPNPEPNPIRNPKSYPNLKLFNEWVPIRTILPNNIKWWRLTVICALWKLILFSVIDKQHAVTNLGVGSGEGQCPLPSSTAFSVYFSFVTVTVTINGLVKLLAFNAHIFPSKCLVSFWN